MQNPNFTKILNFVLNQEGGYVNDPDDRGGATNKGITQNTYNAYRDSKHQAHTDVRNISQAEVEDIYFNRYWLPSKCNTMHPVFAAIVFDTAVNMGVGRVSEFLKAANYASPERFLLARIFKYVEFAKNTTQRKFLFGWLGRVKRLYDFIQTL